MTHKYISRGTFVSVFFLIFLSFNTFAQVGIGTTDPDSNALLDIDATNTPGGLLLPRVNLVAINNPSPLVLPIEAGMTVYNLATAGSGANAVTPGFYYHDGTTWVRIGAGAADPNDKWSLTGNTGTIPNTNFLGTIDNQPLKFRTVNADRFEITGGVATSRGRLRAFDNGSAAEPTYSWSSNIGTGMFQRAANVLGFTTAGTERFRIPNAHQVHGISNGSASYPFYSWASNSRMGMFAAGTNILAFSTNANESMRILADRRVVVNGTTAIANTRLTVRETGANRAIYGDSNTGEGVRGEANAGMGVAGLVTSGIGVYGQADATGGEGGRFYGANLYADGLFAGGGNVTMLSYTNQGTGAAITGRTYGATVMARAVDGLGIAGVGDNLAGLPVRPLGVGVLGYGYQAGIFGDSGYYGQNGVHGRAEGTTAAYGTGVYGENVADLGNGVYGESSNVGVRGYGAHGAILESSNNGGYGAIIWNTGTLGADRIGLAVIGQNGNLTSLPGTGATFTGSRSGGSGWAETTTGTGLIGVGNNIDTASLANSGSGVAGTGNTVGVYGKSNRTLNGIGVIGLGNSLTNYNVPTGNRGAGVAGTGVNIGVFGHATSASGFGVYSSGNFHATGTITSDQPIVAPRGIISDGFAVAEGNMAINGTFSAQNVSTSGNLTASGTKNFIIDDPRDPANKYLKHASIESNEILNLYRGVSTFDASGEVVVQLPDYYDAINKNASYQLTPIGASMPSLYIAEEVNMGSFVIAGGVAGKKVSWTVTAERNDPYIRNNPETRNMVVDKGTERGLYLSPEAYGQSADKGILNNRVSEMRTASMSASAEQTTNVQEMKSETVEATKLDRDEVQKLTSPFEGRRASNMGAKELSNAPLLKADEIKVTPKTLEGTGQGSQSVQQASEGGSTSPTTISEPSTNTKSKH